MLKASEGIRKHGKLQVKNPALDPKASAGAETVYQLWRAIDICQLAVTQVPTGLEIRYSLNLKIQSSGP